MKIEPKKTSEMLHVTIWVSRARTREQSVNTEYWTSARSQTFTFHSLSKDNTWQYQQQLVATLASPLSISALALILAGVIFSIYCPLLLLSHNTARVGLINQYGGGLVGQIRKWFYCWGKISFDQSQGVRCLNWPRQKRFHRFLVSWKSLNIVREDFLPN